MEYKNKALEILNHFMIELYDSVLIDEQRFYVAKECAIKSIDLLIKYTPSVNGRPPNYQDVNEWTNEYWKKVKINLTCFEYEK